MNHINTISFVNEHLRSLKQERFQLKRKLMSCKKDIQEISKKICNASDEEFDFYTGQIQYQSERYDDMQVQLAEFDALISLIEKGLEAN